LLETARLAITTRANCSMMYIIAHISCSFWPPCIYHCKFSQLIHPDRY